MERVAVYIDGFNLYFGIKSKMKTLGWTNCLWLDLYSLSNSLIKSHQEVVICKYFTALIMGNTSKQRRQNTYIEALSTLPDLKILYGEYKNRNQKCRICKNTYQKPEEKMTDVNIAVEMLKDAYTDKFDTAFVISADSDLVPPIKAVKALGKKVIAAFPPRNKSEAIKNNVDAHFTIARKKLTTNQLPDKVTSNNNYVLEKPLRW